MSLLSIKQSLAELSICVWQYAMCVFIQKKSFKRFIFYARPCQCRICNIPSQLLKLMAVRSSLKPIDIYVSAVVEKMCSYLLSIWFISFNDMV